MDEEEKGYQEIRDDYFLWALEAMRKKEAAWRDRECTYAWIDLEPTFTPAADFWAVFHLGGKDEKDVLPDPARPGKRIIRLSLVGGGQIRTFEHFVANREEDSKWFGPVWCRRIDLKVIAHTKAGIVMASGIKYRGACGEMNAQAVVLHKHHQDIADRAAATFRTIDGKLENFYALLDGSEGCAICGRPLRDEISKLVGVGPECASQHNIPHNYKAAEGRLALRKKLLGDGAL